MHEVGGAPTLTADADTNTNGGCSSFSTTIDGVLTPLGGDEYDVTATGLADGGFTLSPSATADDVTEGLSVLPAVDAPMLTYRGVADEQEGNSWTLSFSTNAGAVAALVCVTADDSFVGNCDVSTCGGPQANLSCREYTTMLRCGDVSYNTRHMWRCPIR